MGVFHVPGVSDQPLYELMWMRHSLPCVQLAQDRGVYDLLAGGPRTIGEVAGELDLPPRVAEAIVAVSAGLGFLACGKDGRFSLTELGGTYLASESPHYYGRLMAEEDPHLQKLHEAVEKGDGPVEPRAVKLGELDPKMVEDFIGKMHTWTRAAAGALAKQKSWSGVRNLLDVGGGSGSLSIATASCHPELRSTVFDLEPVCRIAEKNIAGAELSARISTIVGNMFEPGWPAGHDAVLFGNIFHDWDPESCRTFARNAFDALEPGGTIFLHEMPLNERRDGPLLVACFSVSMLLYEKGKQYTLGELEAFLSEAGFVDFKSEATHAYYHLVSARKP